MFATRVYKKAAAVLLAAIMIFSLAACSEGTGGSVVKGKVPSYFISNNLKVTDVNEGEDGDSGYLQYVQISGLKNKEVENSINEQIKSCYDRLCDLNTHPAYRGIALKLEKYPIMQEVYIMMSASANINNILSINVSRSVYFNNETGEGFFGYYETEGLNFDLNTGEQLSLGDMYPNGFDYETAVNNAVGEYLDRNNAADEKEIDYEFNAPTLISEFKGIKENQQFYINEYNGGITLLFGAESPEFFSDFSEVFIELPLDENMSYFNDYLVKTDIFEDESINKKLFEPEREVVAETYNSKERSTDDSNGIYSRLYSVRYPENCPEAITNEIMALYEDTSWFDDKMNELVNPYAEDIKSGDAVASGYLTISLNEDCGYPYIYVTEGIDAYRVNEYENLVSYYETRNICFNKEGTKKLELEDLFKNGVDYQELLYNAVYKYASGLIESDNGSTDRLDELTREMLDNVNGFSIFSNSICLTISNSHEIAAKYCSNKDNVYFYANLCTTAYYADLGCDNLTIF